MTPQVKHGRKQNPQANRIFPAMAGCKIILEDEMKPRHCTNPKALLAACACITATSLAVIPGAAAQQADWRPERAVEIVVGATAGGTQDRMGRLLQKILQDMKASTSPINVINRPGGSGAVSLNYINQHAGNGHLLNVISISILTNHIVGRSPLGPEDFTPISTMGWEYIGVLVRADSPLKTGKDLVDLLRKQPDALTATIGLGPATTLHITYAAAMKAAGVDIRRLKTVGFNSGGQAATALLGGHVDVTVATASNLLPHIQAGRMRMLAVGAPERLTGDLANVPTWRELGVNGVYTLWRGLAGPRGMSRAQTQYWDETLSRVVKSKDWQDDAQKTQMVNVYKNSSETAKFWQEEYEAARSILSELGFAKQR